MSRSTLELLVFFAGLAAIGWIGAGYLGSNPLALAFTLLIGACYVAGALELRRYRQATAALDQALDGLSTPPADLAAWLEPLPATLRQPVRLRVEGERVALPGPALTPYLVGLLVLLGMLGTLLGMMATLRGTGLALESATDLQAIRSSLAAPVAGLAFAFGTSIAGVAASAMLGLLSALCRRQRMRVVQRLDAEIASRLRGHSLAHQREQTLLLLQRQAEAMPVLVDRLQAMMAAIEQRDQTAHDRQLANQQAFHDKTESAYARLAESVAQSLQASVTESARTAGTVLQPAVEATLSALSRETATLHESVTQAVQHQLQALTTGFEASTVQVTALWQQALDQVLSRQHDTHQALATHNQHALQAAVAAFQQHATALLGDVNRSHTQLQAALATQDQQRLAAWNEALASTSAALREDWTQAGVQATSRQQEICDALAHTAQDMGAQARAHAGETIAEISRLVEAASEAPRAAAEVIAELRLKISDGMARDTAMLEERTRMMATLETLLDAVNHASTEQRSAIDALVTTSAELLDRVGTRFTDHIQAETGKLETANAQVTASAAEVASLGDAFGAAVQLFGESSEALATRLQGIEHALERSLVRSDEQLGYYVAQAREVIDLSMLAQQQILEELQQRVGPQALADAEAA